MPGISLNYASRNKRELEAALEYGFEVKVVCADDEEVFRARYPHYELVKDGTSGVRRDVPRLVRVMGHFRNFFRYIAVMRGTECDFVSCHDLRNLALCWLACLGRNRRPGMIYDSHEFEIGRRGRRGAVAQWLVVRLEKYLIEKCSFTIVVNETIADEIVCAHNLSKRPVVVRSTPYVWNLDRRVIGERRAEMERSFGVWKGFVLMYHGNVTHSRGIEQLIKLLSINNEVNLFIMGNGDDGYIMKLKQLAADYKVSERIHFHRAVDTNEIRNYVGAADLEMITIPAVSQSYYYMLPNKFFESIQSETPVICSNFPVIKKTVNDYGIGLTCDPLNIEEINECVERMRNDISLYEKMKEGLTVAKRDLCWENEKKVLFNAFESLSSK